MLETAISTTRKAERILSWNSCVLTVRKTLFLPRVTLHISIWLPVTSIFSNSATIPPCITPPSGAQATVPLSPLTLRFILQYGPIPGLILLRYGHLPESKKWSFLPDGFLPGPSASVPGADGKSLTGTSPIQQQCQVRLRFLRLHLFSPQVISQIQNRLKPM